MPARFNCVKCGRLSRSDAAFCDGCGAGLSASADPSDEPGDSRASGPAVTTDHFTTFVGRLPELTALRAALRRTLSGHGQLCMLVGQAGMGKTRTALQLAEEARQDGVAVLWGRCLEEPGAPPYWPWTQLIRAYLQSSPEQTRRSVLAGNVAYIADIVPELAEWVPNVKPLLRVSAAEHARFQLFDNITLLWKKAARAQPLVMVLDNLHWADATSLRLLAFLAPEIAGSRLLVLGTYRDEEVPRDHPLSEMLADVSRLPQFQRLHLSGLSRAETERFIAAASGLEPSPSLVAALYERTEGNPLYLTEMARWLLQDNRLQTSSRADHDVAAVRIPEGIREVVGKRLNRLSPSCNRLLKIAAVIGRTFWLELLAKLAPESSQEAVLSALEEARSAHIIEELAQPSHFQFSHALIRETLYEELLAARRAGLHQRIGEVLENLGRPEAYLAQLAYHFSQASSAGSSRKTIDYATRAARRAEELLAYEEASRLYKLALGATKSGNTASARQQVELMLSLGQAQAKAGDALPAMETFKHAAASAQQQNFAEHLTRAALGFEEASWRLGLPGNVAIRLLQTALDALGENDSVAKIKVLGALTRAFILTGDLESSDRFQAQALAMARSCGDPATLMGTLFVGLTARWTPERIKDRISAAGEALALAQQIGDREKFVHILGWRLFDAMELGDMETMQADLKTHARLAEELQQPFYRYVSVSFNAMLAVFQGRFSEGEQLAQSALTLGQRMPGLDANGVFGMQMFSLRRAQGRLRELTPVVRQFVNTTAESATWGPGLALIYADLGLRREARVEFEKLAAQDFSGIPRDAVWATCIAYLAQVCAFLNDDRRAPTLYRFLLPYDGRNILAGTTVACYGAAAHFLGLLAATMARWNEAEKHFEDALAMNERTGAKPLLAHTLFDYAAMLSRRGDADNRARAIASLERASALSAELEMRALTERIATLQQRLGVQSGKAAYPDGLTRREIEVLQLIATGKGNSEIGALLFISPNTVANHIRNILAKTKTSNRTEAAAYAVRHELVTG